MLEAGLFFLMLFIILGILGLMAWWNGVVNRRERHNITSSASPPPVAAGPRIEPRPLVRPQQDYAGAVQSVDFATVREWISEHNLTDEQAIELFAAAHRLPGDYFLSANKIRDGVGGSRDEVLAQVAALRPKPPAPKPKAHLDRPVNGW